METLTESEFQAIMNLLKNRLVESHHYFDIKTLLEQRVTHTYYIK